MKLKAVTLIVLSLLGLPSLRGQRVEASPGAGLRIVDASDVTKTTPVVNERGRLQLKVVDGSGNQVAVTSWSTDNKSVGKVNRKRGVLKGKAFGFATITAQTAQGPVSGFIVVARVRTQTGAMTQGDTKTDTGGNVYLSSPTRHVLYKASGLSAEVFAGHIDQGGYQDGTGDGIRFNGPAGIGVDNRAEGGLYIADTMNDCIRKVDFRERSSLAAGVPGFAGTMHGDENPIAEAVFDNPRGVASVGSNLYVTDTNNHCVWYVDVQRQVVELVAGEPGEPGNENGQGRTARFDHPSGITINTRGNLLAVADTGNNLVRLIAIAPRQGGGVIGNVTTLGLGSSSRNADILAKLDTDRGSDQITFDQPISVSFDGVDNVYVIDNQTASVVTRPSSASGRPVERVDLAQVGTLGDPASVTVRRTQAFVLNEAPTSEQDALSLVEVGGPAITSVTPDTARLEGGQQVTMTGTNFAPESKLTLGDAEVTNYTVETSTRLTFTVPAQQAPGGRTLSILTRGGTAQQLFRILPKPYAELATGEITTIAGGVQYVGDGGRASEARTPYPGGVTLDGFGNVYLAGANRVRRIEESTGTIVTVAGNGLNSSFGDGGDALTAGIRAPQDVVVDGSGNIYVADASRRIRKIDAVTRQISTIAGNGTTIPIGDGGPATSAGLYSPVGLCIDPDGNLLVAEYFHCRIRKVDLRSMVISTLAGTSQSGYAGDGGLATNASLLYPQGVATDSSGNVYIADTGNSVVRRIDRATGVISTVAGTGQAGDDVDGALATSSRLNQPTSIAVRSDGVVIIADTANNKIKSLDPATGLLMTIAGDGIARYSGDGGQARASSVSAPVKVAIDSQDDVIVADTGNQRIRSIDGRSGVITALAGIGVSPLGDGDLAIFGSFDGPTDIEFDSDGNLLVADAYRIRRIEQDSGVISTIAGSGVMGYEGDGGPAATAAIGYCYGIAIDGEGNVLVGDLDHSVIRRIDGASATISTYAGTGRYEFSADGLLATDTSFQSIYDVEIDSTGGLVIAEQDSFRVRRVDPVTGRVSTVAGDGSAVGGGDGGSAMNASVVPESLASDQLGHLFIGDFAENCVRRIGLEGAITRYAGNGMFGSSGDGGAAINAALGAPSALTVDRDGNLFVSVLGAYRIRRVDDVTRIINTVAGTGISGYSGDGGSAAAAEIGLIYGLAVSSSGDLAFSDSRNRSLRLVRGVATARRPGRVRH